MTCDSKLYRGFESLSPPADVINEQSRKVRLLVLYVRHQSIKTLPGQLYLGRSCRDPSTPERFPYRARRRIEGSLPIGFRGNTVGALWTCARIALPGGQMQVGTH